MAELEAITNIPASKDRPAAAAGQFTRRFTIVPGLSIRLGRDEARMDWAIPEDDQISRFYAILRWDGGTQLTVERRGSIPPDYPEPPANKIVVVNKEPGSKDKFREVALATIGPGDSFWIGQTQFTLRTDSEPVQESPVDMTVAPRIEERTRAQLEAIPFADPAVALKAMEQLPSTIKAAGNEQGLFRQMLKVIMDAMPRADAAGIVRIPPGCPPGERRLAVVESNIRSPVSFGPKGFVPSRKLSHKAISEVRKRSHLHIWSTDPKDVVGSDAEAADMTLASMHQQNVTPWAICSPFQDGSKFALYIAGRVNGQWTALPESSQKRTVDDLMQYQKIAELIVGLLETTLRMSRLSKQNTVIRQAWPRGIWKYLDDPERLEALLKPAEKEVTILFCDLRNYSLFATENSTDLLKAWREVAFALDTMSGTITLLDGVVAGFRGDAVLGFWGWPDGNPKQLEKAAQAAVTIREKLGGWLMDKKCGLGLTHGPAVAGRLGAHDLAVVDLYGPVVNLAFRLEAMTKAFGVGIIVTQEVAERVARADPDGHQLRTRKLGRVRAKGFTEPLAAYELFPAHAASVSDWQTHDWETAVELFTDGKWDEAYEMLAANFPDDPAAKCLLRVMDQNKKRVPAAWDGSFVPGEPGA
ncbi:MAG TPA: adenylate/guanylate cyclase domain-containing protein [Urbifossiella sp.]|nr:adenylate/guanylate cyclase domain-containing protein [Urbifossiella sp.]